MSLIPLIRTPKTRRDWLRQVSATVGGGLLASGLPNGVGLPNGSVAAAGEGQGAKVPEAEVTGVEVTGVEVTGVEVTGIRRAFWNGEHNAFTDLCWFQDRIYLTFRSCPDGHMVHPTSCVIVLCSEDLGKSWKETHRFSVPQRDTRDPHFLVFRGRLFVYSGTWYSGATTLPRDDYDLNLHLGYAAWTDDGAKWQSPIMLEGTFGHYIWRAAVASDRAWLCGRRKSSFDVKARGEPRETESLILESEDGLVWRRAGQFQASAGDETAFLFDDQGRGMAIARDGQGQAAGLLQAPRPSGPWTRSDLGVAIGGPLLTRWQGRHVVGGRRTTPDEGPRTALWWLIEGKLKPLATLPSGGDNSYPGLVELPDGSALLSWYSSHEKDDRGKAITAIYLAELRAR
jgi:hypothetical protein